MSATFFLSVRGTEDNVRNELAKRKLAMVGEPCSAGVNTTTVRVETNRAPLSAWMKENEGKTALPGTLLSYSEDY